MQMDVSLYYIPFYILVEYLSVPDMIKLSKVDPYFSNEIYHKAKPTVSIKDVQQGLKYMAIFKNVRLKLSLDDTDELTFDKIKFDKLTELDVGNNPTLTNDFLMTYGTNLVSLGLARNEHITNSTLGNLTKLTYLELFNNKVIENDALSRLMNLKHFSIGDTSRITSAGLSTLKNLETLDLAFDEKIDDDCLIHLQLKKICIGWNDVITDRGLLSLQSLTSLNISSGSNITDFALCQMTSLVSLKMNDNTKITDAGI